MEQNSDRQYLISIDGGGTKTGICVYDCTLQNYQSSQCGGGNYKTHGLENVRTRLLTELKNMLPDVPDIPKSTLFLVMGISGCDSSQDISIYTDMMHSMGFEKKKMLVCNDSEMVFRSTAEAPGICIVAGTGTIAISFERNGNTHRAGGWGAPISDEGSGYWIGAEMIRQYLRWIDGLGDFNDFFRRFREIPGCTSYEDAAARLAEMDTPHTAEWAKPVSDTADRNMLCREIIINAAQKTAELAASVYRKSAFEKEGIIHIVESGSLFNNTLYEKSFQSSFGTILQKNNFKFMHPKGIPAEDGIRLALKLANESSVTQSCD